MKSSNSGTNTLSNSVTAISKFGFWLICEEKEYFIAFANYPAFKNASVSSIFNIKTISTRQLSWPDIDVDIEIDALDKPEGFPLIFK
jgi:hypothetical protein